MISCRKVCAYRDWVASPWHLREPPSVPVMNRDFSPFWHTLSVWSVRLLDEWEAVPLAAPLPSVEEARRITRPWAPVRVPGHWQLEDAFAAYEGFVLYRCRFEGVRAPFETEMLSLRFGGVYYSARVWLNGVYLGSHEGYFAAFEFDCAEAVTGGENELLAEVYSPEEPDENDRKTLGGVWARWDGMSPHLNPGGIFREVALVRSGKVRIRSLGVEADSSGRGRVFVDLYARRGTRTSLAGFVDPLGFEASGAEFEEVVWVELGCTRFEVRFFLPHPRLWWTWDRGEQPLYELLLVCDGHEERVRFGVRSVELRDWKVYLNGERTFLRGINYLPTDVYPARSSEERLRTDARLVREANMNAVRVHAHVAEEGFYAACDELGLLVLQDFPLQWIHRREVLKSAVAQAGEMSRHLRNHPSVGIYLAHDEPFYVAPPEKWTTLGLLRTVVEVLSPRWVLWQRRVLDPAVVRAIEEVDSSRPVIEAAGHLSSTNHVYFGWYYGRFRDLERVVNVFPGLSRLPTEYGAQALPNPESLEEIWPENREPDWDTLSCTYRLQVGRMRRYVPWKHDRLAYVWESQTYQAGLLKHATELFRRRKYRPTGGTFAFMLNDPAPAISWSVVDWRRRPKAAYEVLAAAMSPVLICSQYPRGSYDVDEEISLPLFVVNDLPQLLGRLRWTWELYLEGTRVAHGSGEVEISADSVVRLGQARARLPAPGRAVLRLILLGKGEAYKTNSYEFFVRSGRAPYRGPLAPGR
jgi:beta-mannosidase